MDARVVGDGILGVFQAGAAMIFALYVLVIALFVSLAVSIGVIVYWACSSPSVNSETNEVPAIRAVP